ncbi:MAG: hypothetical protein KGR26_11235, partial [Cyanobacteria bacterium REEB65]|nr:hypothetical protein [Cyanobacteria bacterium REEB65]
NPGRSGLAKLLCELQLTASQRARLAAIRGDLVTWHAAARSSLPKALQAFVQTGDATGLTAAMQSRIQDFPVADLAAAIATLDLSQRRTLVDFIDARLAQAHHWAGESR